MARRGGWRLRHIGANQRAFRTLRRRSGNPSGGSTPAGDCRQPARSSNYSYPAGFAPPPLVGAAKRCYLPAPAGRTVWKSLDPVRIEHALTIPLLDLVLVAGGSRNVSVGGTGR
jgi:hypothetical protein